MKTPIYVPALSVQQEIATLQFLWKEERQLATTLFNYREQIINNTCQKIMNKTL